MSKQIVVSFTADEWAELKRLVEQAYLEHGGPYRAGPIEQLARRIAAAETARREQSVGGAVG